jgi:hypothetical protein
MKFTGMKAFMNRRRFKQENTDKVRIGYTAYCGFFTDMTFATVAPISAGDSTT